MASMSVEAFAGERDDRGAVRFFWAWLFVAAAMSVAGNVTHAVLNTSGETVELAAAAAAVVPPAVLLGSTHSVAVLVRARRVGVTYWCALTMTIALAGCAFVLSFDALRDLAVGLGFRPGRAWLWPVAIDVSIAQSTLALLTLAPRRQTQDGHDRRGTRDEHDGSAPLLPSPSDTVSAADRPSRAGPESWVTRPAPETGTGGGPALAVVAGSSPQRSDRVPDSAAVRQWAPTAHQLVRDGVTSKDPDTVAAILAEHAAGTPPSTIGRRQNVHHTTVGRILAAAQPRTG